MPSNPTVTFQPRDIALMCDLFASRLMTLSHASSLHFARKREMAKKRIQKLKAEGLIRDRRRRAAEPSVLYLTTSGFKLLRDRGELGDYPRIGIDAFEKRSRVSDLTVRHELAVMDVKASMADAIAKTQSYRISEFATWPRLHSFSAYRRDGQKIVVKPDGFMRIIESKNYAQNEIAYFLEVDRSTETLTILLERCHCYVDYYRSGGFAARHGRPPAEFKAFPFRVLIVCKSQERRDNIARRLLDSTPPILTFVQLTTMRDLLADPLGRIWTQPAAYREENESGQSGLAPNHPLTSLLE